MYVVKIKQYYFSKLIVCHLCGLFSCYVCFIYWYIYMFYFQLAILQRAKSVPAPAKIKKMERRNYDYHRNETF